MNPIPAHILPSANWWRTRLALTVLVSLLQRTPALRLAQAAVELASAPFAAILKSATAVLAALGAVHTLAGATSLVASQPSPVALTEGRAITPIAFTVTDTINLGSWRLGGTLPPGLRLTASQGGTELTGPGTLDATSGGGRSSDDPYEAPVGGGGNTMTTPVLVGTPTQAGNYTITLQAYQLGGLTGFNTVPFSYTINVAAATTPTTNVAPTFSAQPVAQTVAAGANVTLTAAAGGTPAPTYQWQKGGVAIAGATAATLTLTNVQAADAGTYTVIATNAAGSATSTAAITVNVPAGGAAPTIARQPQPQTVAMGSTVVFTADATSTGLSYQWRKNGTNIPNATRSALVLSGASAADAGSYSVVISNSAGTITSSGANLTLSSDPNFGHLVNLSIRTFITTNEPYFTIGTVVGGTGTKAILIRAVGPSLSAFQIDTAIRDSHVDVKAGGNIVASNNNWAGDPALSAAFTAVSAFPFVSPTSLDAAVYNPAFPARDYTIEVSGVGGATGEVIAELYDASPTVSFNGSQPRLVNVSVRKDIDTGSSLTAGFTLGGNTARTVLVRAIGPGLAAFNLEGTMVDPKLALFAGGSEKVAENDNWGGDPQITAAGNTVSAFAVANAASRDAMLLVTLPPGGYTAEVSGVPGTAGGTTIVEIYEIP